MAICVDKEYPKIKKIKKMSHDSVLCAQAQSQIINLPTTTYYGSVDGFTKA